MKYAIQVDRLKKSYGDHPVLKGLNFNVIKGEIFALLGVNGAGKTTNFYCGIIKYWKCLGAGGKKPGKTHHDFTSDISTLHYAVGDYVSC